MHLEGCTTCRAEVMALERYTAATLRAPADDASVVATNESMRWLREVARRLAGTISGIEWTTAWAYAAALIAVLAVGLWWTNTTSRGGSKSPETPVVIERRATPTEPRVVPDAPAFPPREAPRESSQLAERGADPGLDGASDSGGESESLPPPSRPPEARGPVGVASSDTTEPDSSRPPERIHDNGREADEILLASLSNLPTPDYASPPTSPGSMAWLRQFGPVRSGSEAAAVRVRAPIDHVGLTLDDSPRLWWSLGRDTEHALQLTIIDDIGIEPILRVDLPGPHPAGLHSFDLAEHDIVIESDREYRWFVSVLEDPSRPSLNPVSGGAIRRAEPTAAAQLRRGQESATSRGHELARAGIWYDAYDFFASLAAAHPERQPLSAHRESLERQISKE